MANWYCHTLYLLNGFQVIIFPWSQFFVSWETWRCRSVVSHTIRLRTILNSDFLPKFGHSVRWQELVEGLVFLSSFWRRLLSHNPVVIVFIREGKHVVVNEFSPHLFPIRCTKSHLWCCAFFAQVGTFPYPSKTNECIVYNNIPCMCM